MTELARRRRWPVLMSAFMGGTALLIVIGIVQSPGEAFRASLSGLQIWWQQVFPGLVTPLILAELLAASGLLHGLAVLAEPLARGWFRLPGAAGWAIAFGWSAGVPAGAKETARLRDAGHIRGGDADTLLIVSHMPNPFLIIVVTGAGFMQSPALGWAIAAGVWLGAVIAGIVWPRLIRSAGPASLPSPSPGGFAALLRRAAYAAGAARLAETRPLGKQLADGVTHAVGTLMNVGGLMMLASVVLCLVQLRLPGSDAWLAIPGLYEMHLGAYESGRSPLFESAPAQAAALLAAALAWTGWSGLLQARAAYGGSAAFPWGKFVAGKLLQAALALLITYPIAEFVLSGGTHPAAGIVGLLPESPLVREVAAVGVPGWTGWRHLPEIWLAGLSNLAIFLLLTLLAILIRPKLRRRNEPAPPPEAKK